jgi:Tol biopolymer transport system component
MTTFKITPLFAFALFVFACSQSTSPPPDLMNTSMIDCCPSWSPENNLIAYVHYWTLNSTSSDSTGIYVIRPDGAGKSLIYKDYLPFSVDWSPDSRALIVNDNKIVVKILYPELIVDTLTGVGEYWGIEWSPDGTRFAFSKRAGPERGVYTMAANGDSARLVARYGDFVSWPYEDSLAYYDRSQELLHNVVISDTNGIGKRIAYIPPSSVIEGTTIAKLHSLSGRMIIQQQEIGENPGIWKKNQGDTHAIKLFAYAKTPEFYSDADSIIFCDIHGGNGRLWIISWDGSGLRQLTR